jgi:hypothetical protein
MGILPDDWLHRMPHRRHTWPRCTDDRGSVGKGDPVAIANWVPSENRACTGVVGASRHNGLGGAQMRQTEPCAHEMLITGGHKTQPSFPDDRGHKPPNGCSPSASIEKVKPQQLRKTVDPRIQSCGIDVPSVKLLCDLIPSITPDSQAVPL